MFLSKILKLSCTTKHCTMTEYIKQMIKMATKGETVKFKNYTRKVRSPFMIYADF